MLTLLAIIGVICFILWIIGVLTHALPGDLVSAALIIWIVALVIIVVLAGFGHARFGVWF